MSEAVANNSISKESEARVEELVTCRLMAAGLKMIRDFFYEESNTFFKCVKWMPEKADEVQSCKELESNVVHACTSCRVKYHLQCASWALGQYILERRKAPIQKP